MKFRDWRIGLHLLLSSEMTRSRVVILACLLLSSHRALAADSFSDMGMFQFVHARDSSFDYTGELAPGSSPVISDHRLRGAVVVKKDDQDLWTLNARAANFHLTGNGVTIAATGVVIPQNLWDLEVGGSYSHHISERSDTSVSLSVGSASDEPFHGIDETVFHATATYSIPSGKQNRWLFFLVFSNNSTLLNYVPFPGFAYEVHDPEDGFEGIFGLPFFSVMYRPIAQIDLRASAIFTNISAEAGYLPFLEAGLPFFRTYAGYYWNQRAWLRAGRTDEQAELFFDRMQAGMGIRSPISAQLSVDLFSGWEFNRQFLEGDRIFSDVPAVDLQASWFVQLKLVCLSL
jgi:hypothetical protein